VVDEPGKQLGKTGPKRGGWKTKGGEFPFQAPNSQEKTESLQRHIKTGKGEWVDR